MVDHACLSKEKLHETFLISITSCNFKRVSFAQTLVQKFKLDLCVSHKSQVTNHKFESTNYGIAKWTLDHNQSHSLR